jgi:hypothetical protein
MCAMQQDFLGNPVSAMPPAVLAAVDDFIGGFLAYETRAERIVHAALGAPESCLANVYAGFLWMFLEAPEAATRAAVYRDAAAAAATATVRERLNLELLDAWMADDQAAALVLCERIADDHPRDLVALKLHQYFEFNRGNAPAMLRIALKALDRNADVAYVHGMAAFAFEQCHLLDQAEGAARTALQRLRKEPWAQHALAHVMLTRGQIDAGAAFLEGVEDTWTDLNSFMVTHLWWHLALFHLSQGRDARVLEIYDRHCWGVAKDYSQDQIGAVSLLARLELAGVDVGGRWAELAGYLAARTGDTVQPFLTLQYLYGLARAGRPEADALLAAVRRAAESAPEFSRTAWRQVALPAAEGLIAHARGDADSAWRLLGSALPRMTELGGSHAQRDLFDQILLDSAIRSGRHVQAQRLLELRRTSDPHGVPVNAALAEVYDALQLPAQANQARERVAATRRRWAS